MTAETEQKILDAALKLFSKKGYQSATTMAIAEQAGVSEKTLFRKFKTKRNLYDEVAVRYIARLNEDFSHVLTDYKCETPQDFLKAIINDLTRVCIDNYEIIHLILEETSTTPESALGEWVELVSGHIKKNIKNDALDYPIFTMTILFFIYSLVGETYHGRTLFDIDESLEKFINNIILTLT
jgi:Transcriptional regulator